MITPFVQVETYSTMNFATLGPSLLRPPFTGASVVSFETESLTNFLDLPALGRRQPPYIVYDFAETCVFDKQFHEPIRCDLPNEWEGTPSSEVTGSVCRVP